MKMASNSRKTYRIAPSFDWPADGGPIQIGNIITNPNEPQRPIVSDGFDLPDKVYTSDKNDFSKLLAENTNFVVGLYLKILEAVHVDISGELIRSNMELLKTKKLETKYIIPTDEYIDGRMQDERVQNWMVANRMKAYMITGVKIAYDPSARGIERSKRSAGATVGGSGSAAGVPAGAKAEVKHDDNRTGDVSFRGGTDIIFAYELREIKYKVVKKKKVLSTKDYVKGTKMSGDERKRNETKQEYVDVAQSLGLEQGGAGPEDKIATITDDGEENWDFVVPKVP
jgi:hypothetical protein